MNKSMIRFLLSKLLLIEAALLAIPLTVGLIYREPQSVMMSIVITMIILSSLDYWVLSLNLKIIISTLKKAC